MTRIELAPEVLGDFDRIIDHLIQFEVPDAPERIAEVMGPSRSCRTARSSGGRSRAASGNWSLARRHAAMSRCTGTSATSMWFSFWLCVVNGSLGSSRDAILRGDAGVGGNAVGPIQNTPPIGAGRDEKKPTQESRFFTGNDWVQ